MLIVSIRFSWASSLPRIIARIAKLGAKLKSGGEGSELNNRERWRKSKVEKFNVAEGRDIRSAVVKAEDDNGCASNAEGRVKGRLKETLPRLEREAPLIADQLAMSKLGMGKIMMKARRGQEEETKLMAKRRNWGEERLERLEIFRYYSYSFSLKGSETGQGLEIFKIFWAAVQRRNTKKKRRKEEKERRTS